MNFMVIGVSILTSSFLWLWFYLRHDRHHPMPIFRVVTAFFIGGILTAPPAAFLNDFMVGYLGIDMMHPDTAVLDVATFSLFVGLNEELLKFLVTLLLIRRQETAEEPIDSVIIAMTVALGFAAVENAVYVMGFGVSVIIVRSVTAVPLHIGLALMWGIGIARKRFRSDMKRRFVETVWFAILLHAAYDLILSVGSETRLALPLMAIFVGGIFLYMERSLIQMSGQSQFIGAGVCPACGTRNAFDANFCGRCGREIARSFFLTCTNCGTQTGTNAEFCPGCGAGLTNDEHH